MLVRQHEIKVPLLLMMFITGFRCFCSKTNQIHQFLKFIVFWNNTLHVSDGLSVHRQEFKTVHTTTAICLTYACCCIYRLELLMMDGKTVRNMYSVIPKYKKFEKLVHLVGFIIEVYYDAQPYERKI